MTSHVVLVTGGAGYIGSHAVRALQQAGFQPLVLDNLVYGHRAIVDRVLQVPLVVGDVADRPLLDALLSGRHPILAGQPVQAVLHFAAFAYVGESVLDPARYYRNNLAASLTLLEALVAARPHRPIPLVFSSTCATYGLPERLPLDESHPQNPINPYGRSKWMVEQLIQDFAAAYGLPAVIFRYFNAAGADPAADLGEDHTPETHLIPLLLGAIAGQRSPLAIYGNDYPTPDGTCIRDYIHVSDLAAAHVLGLQSLLAADPPSPPRIYNLGTGNGFSVREVIAAAEAVTGRSAPIQMAERRPGDPAQLVAAAKKAEQELGWQPRHGDLGTILCHAWAWHQRQWQR